LGVKGTTNKSMNGGGRGQGESKGKKIKTSGDVHLHPKPGGWFPQRNKGWAEWRGEEKRPRNEKKNSKSAKKKKKGGGQGTSLNCQRLNPVVKKIGEEGRGCRNKIRLPDRGEERGVKNKRGITGGGPSINNGAWTSEKKLLRKMAENQNRKKKEREKRKVAGKNDKSQGVDLPKM